MFRDFLSLYLLSAVEILRTLNFANMEGWKVAETEGLNLADIGLNLAGKWASQIFF